MLKTPKCALILLGCLWVSSGFAALSPDQQAFVADLVDRHGFDAAYVEQVLRNARHDKKIVAAISRPAEGLPWYKYRKIFLRDDRITGGVDYWRTHEEVLRAAEAAYGVPPELITAIIGVETKYGAFTGKHRVADALKTLGFGYPKRADFFRKELEEFLLMAREEDIDPMSPRGSYAGAMGKPQFIASSFRAYAVDFDEDGRRDLWKSDADAIGSVANYFREHGWQPGEPVTTRLHGNADALDRLSSGGRKPDQALTDINEALDEKLPPEIDLRNKAVVLKLDQKDDVEYWAGYDNFYVITRYNHSNLYAMAVYQLSEAIRKRYLAGQDTVSK